LLQNLYLCLALRMLRGGIHEHAHAPRLRRLLRVRGDRPSGVGAAKNPDKAAGRIKLSHLGFGTYCC
jgi:hypothetical protein